MELYRRVDQRMHYQLGVLSVAAVMTLSSHYFFLLWEACSGLDIFVGVEKTSESNCQLLLWSDTDCNENQSIC
jgi:hypothetical protein